MPKRPRNLRLGVCQILVGTDKQKNILTASAAVRKAADDGAKMVVLPECWNSPYAVDQFKNYAEVIPKTMKDIEAGKSPSVRAMSDLAKELEIYLVGGSIPEASSTKLYNTSLTFDPLGEIVAKHRKIHLST